MIQPELIERAVKILDSAPCAARVVYFIDNHTEELFMSNLAAWSSPRRKFDEYERRIAERRALNLEHSIEEQRRLARAEHQAITFGLAVVIHRPGRRPRCSVVPSYSFYQGA